ncbi:hypothetical protein ADK67_33740 [Saccharothrix sp. NRRL B-16348]|nr:hypothetical protein ADK67_33740 [Saccharothrix sp. NRRL B-16348]
MLTAVVLLTAVASPAHARIAADEDKADFTLEFKPAAGKLTSKKVTMEELFADLNHDMVRNDEACDDAIKRGVVLDTWYCFDPDDKSSRGAWIPQGVSHASDAFEDEKWNGRSPLIVSWYNGASTRVTFIDQDLQYRHVRLVVPNASGTGYRNVSVHAGGVLWYEQYIYLVDTKNGLRVFDTQQIHRGSGSDKYVLPQIGVWKTKTASKSENFCTNNPDARFSYIGLDRSSHRILVGEYCRSRDSSNGRLVAYSASAGRPSVPGTPAVPSDVWDLPVPNIQGAASDGTYFYLNQTGNAEEGPSTLHRVTASGRGMTSVKTKPAPTGAEDLSLERSRGLLWSVTEYQKPGRMLYRMAKTF